MTYGLSTDAPLDRSPDVAEDQATLLFDRGKHIYGDVIHIVDVPEKHNWGFVMMPTDRSGTTAIVPLLQCFSCLQGPDSSFRSPEGV